MCLLRFTVSIRNLLKTKMMTRIMVICQTAATVSILDWRILGVTVMKIGRRKNRALMMMMMMMM